MSNVLQEDREMDLDGFKFKFGDEPKKDDLTIFVPRQDDPTDTVSPIFHESIACLPLSVDFAHMYTSGEWGCGHVRGC